MQYIGTTDFKTGVKPSNKPRKIGVLDSLFSAALGTVPGCSSVRHGRRPKPQLYRSGV